MAKLEITLTKEQHESLEESLKQFYVPTQGGGFELEGVGSIQRALVEERAKKATKPELAQEVEELRKFKADHEAAESKAAHDLLVKQGEFEKAQENRDKEWQARVDAEKSERDALFNFYHRERLQNELVKKGVLPDRAEFLIDKMASETELYKESETGNYNLRKKGGIGDAAAFDGLIEAAKTASPFFFASTNASGSGASASNGNGGGSDMSGLSPQAKLEKIYSQQK